MGADRITAGPSITGLNPFDQEALVLDVSNNILETSGNTHVMTACQTALFLFAAQTALVTITTAQNMISKTLNAGVLNKANRMIRIRGSLIYTSPGTTTPTMTIAVTLGGVALCSITIGAISATASTNMPIQFEFFLLTVGTGSAGTIESHGRVDANITAATPNAALTTYSDTNTAVSAAVNLTTALALLVTVAASLTVTSAQLRLGIVDVLN